MSGRAGQRGVAAVMSVLLVPAALCAVGLAVDSGCLYMQIRKVQNACQVAALAAFERPVRPSADTSAAELAGGIALEMAGFAGAAMRVTVVSADGSAPVAKAVASGITIQTPFAGMITGGSWTWNLDGLSAKATRKPFLMSIVIDASGSTCNTLPYDHADRGDGLLPKKFYEDLRDMGGLDYINDPAKSIRKPWTSSNPDAVYSEVPARSVWLEERFHTCEDDTSLTWFSDYVESARRFATGYLVPGYDKVGIVSFNWDAYEELPVGLFDAVQWESALRRLQAKGPSNLAAAIRMARNKIASAANTARPEAEQRVILLLSDGGANVLHARFTNPSGPAQPGDPFYRVDMPGAENQPVSVVAAPTAVTPGLGSIYPSAGVKTPEEYVVLFSPDPFQRWVFKRTNPGSSLPFRFEDLELAPCGGKYYLHRFRPDEYNGWWKGWGANKTYLEYPPTGGSTTAKTTIYGTYAMERCFDSYDYEDWDGVRHTGQSFSQTGTLQEVPDSFTIPVPAFSVPIPDPTSGDRADSYIAAYMAADAKLLRWGAQYGSAINHPSAAIVWEPMKQALREAAIAKSDPHHITIHSLSYGFAGEAETTTQHPFPGAPSSPPDPYGTWRSNNHATNNNEQGADHLMIKVRLADGVMKGGVLAELTHYLDDSVIPNDPGADWTEHARGSAVIFAPKSVQYFTSGGVMTNTPDNDAKFNRRAATLFGSLTRKAARPFSE